MHHNILFRKAAPEDCALVYAWFQDPVTRANSFSRSQVTFEDHSQWFLSRIQQTDAPYWVFYQAEHPEILIGQVRIDLKAEGPVIGINLAPEHRGHGYAAIMLRLAAASFSKQNKAPIRAWIMNSNTASGKAFTAAGFRFDHEEIIEGIPSSLYLYHAL